MESAEVVGAAADAGCSAAIWTEDDADCGAAATGGDGDASCSADTTPLGWDGSTTAELVAAGTCAACGTACCCCCWAAAAAASATGATATARRVCPARLARWKAASHSAQNTLEPDGQSSQRTTPGCEEQSSHTTGELEAGVGAAAGAWFEFAPAAAAAGVLAATSQARGFSCCAVAGAAPVAGFAAAWAAAACACARICSSRLGPLSAGIGAPCSPPAWALAAASSASSLAFSSLLRNRRLKKLMVEQNAFEGRREKTLRTAKGRHSRSS